MNSIIFILLLIGAITLFLYVREKLKAYSLKAVFLKTTVSLFFLAVAVCGWFLSAQAGGLQVMGVFFVLGLLFGLLGDIWLDLKYVYPAHDDPFTYAGFLSFAIGHVLYITGMLLQYQPKSALYVILPIALAVLVSGGNILLEKTMKLDFGKMRLIVFGYGAILFSTVLVAGSLALQRGWHEPTLNLIFVGGILFALSDLVLSGTYFGGKERPVDIILNYLTYYPAQFLIALSLLYLR
ncbi:MAG: hypothetical protein IJ112_02620 [Oscillospiraceae bacterium]|nr:hypothetical protein [Oscillospiraceae bacterium]